MRVVLLDPVSRHTCLLVLCSESIVCTLNWENNPSWVRPSFRKADKSFWCVLRNKTHHKDPRIVAVWFDWEGLAIQSLMTCSQQANCLVGPAYRMVLNALADFGVCMRVARCYLVLHPHTHTPAYFSSSVLNSESSLERNVMLARMSLGTACVFT